MTTLRCILGWARTKSSVLAVGWALPTLLVVGCPQVLPPNGGGGGDGGGGGTVTEKAFVGAIVCQQCHPSKHSDWLGTAHATALDDLEAIGQGENAECVGCHTVGFGQQDGFVDRATTPDLAGVQCENCHGAAGAHTRDSLNAQLKPVIPMSSDVCGACHTNAHHPTFDEWKLSKHATALEGLRSNPFAQDACLECHSLDYRLAVERQEVGDDVEVPTLETAQFSIECATCHEPHGGVAQEHQLRKPIANLCGECHTQEDATLGDTPHHPQFEMVTGVGAFTADGADLTVLFSPHAVLFAEGDKACAQCHVVMHDVAEPNSGNPNVTGHTFNPFDEEITALAPEHQAAEFEGCMRCHSESVASEHHDRVEAEIQGRLDALAPLFDSSDPAYIDPDSLPDDAARQNLATATFNFKFVGADGSHGVHNSFYARAALDVADGIVSDLTGQ